MISDFMCNSDEQQKLMGEVDTWFMNFSDMVSFSVGWEMKNNTYSSGWYEYVENAHPGRKWAHLLIFIYRQVSNISRTLAGYKIVDHSDVVAASPVGAAPTTSSFLT